MNLPCLSKNVLIARLEKLLEEHPGGGIIFDADGTLWNTDVGCMVFDLACKESRFRQEALDALVHEAFLRKVTVDPGSDVNQVARALQHAFYACEYDERAGAEMQVWAYVGYSELEFRKLARQALSQGKLRSFLHDQVLEIAEWAHSVGAQVGIVSASPRWVVEEAVADFPFFKKSEICAGDATLVDKGGELRIAGAMASPLPYGPDKVHGGRALLGELPWLAAFGDSNFDLEMMREAKIGVGIGEKPSMLAGLAKIPHGVRLFF